MRNVYLMFVSWFFYYKTSGLFLMLLAFVTLSDWIIARQIHKSQITNHKSPIAKILLALSVTIDLGFLAYFKYAYFFTDAFNDLFGTSYSIVDKIILPVGISFYTFQVISYTADVYHKRIEPVKNILDFGFYVSFFPQLVAGPIVRAAEFIPQLYKPFRLSRRAFGIAVFWIINGLAKKIIMSDFLAVNLIDRVFDNPLLFSGFENLFALFAYSLQVYADFSGYTDIAIGVAMLMGFYLPMNFNSPYKSQSPQEFWRRWHISLTTWFRDYVYIPLGGSRPNVVEGGMLNVESKKKFIIARNTFIIFLVSGIWHGANWTFLAWGVYHAALFLPLILLGKNRRYVNKESRVERGEWIEIPRMVLTFGLVVIGWIIFRAETIGQAWEYISSMCSMSLFKMPMLNTRMYYVPLFIGLMTMLTIEWFSRQRTEALPVSKYAVVNWAIYVFLAVQILVFGAFNEVFIYFQF